MKIIVEIPDKEYSFFMEFVKRLKNTKVQDISKMEFSLSAADKKLIDERLKDLEENPSDVSEWSTVKKRLQSKIKKGK
jgi:hypothetical protein